MLIVLCPVESNPSNVLAVPIFFQPFNLCIQFRLGLVTKAPRKHGEPEPRQFHSRPESESRVASGDDHNFFPRVDEIDRAAAAAVELLFLARNGAGGNEKRGSNGSPRAPVVRFHDFDGVFDI